MSIRAVCMLCLVVPLVGGCGKSTPATDEAPSEYPLRSDLIVVKQLAASPSGWPTLGYPPMAELKNPRGDFSADAAALAKERELKNIIDPKKLNGEAKKAFVDELKKLFGTPKDPFVNLQPASLKTSASIEKETKKIPGLDDSVKLARTELTKTQEANKYDDAAFQAKLAKAGTAGAWLTLSFTESQSALNARIEQAAAGLARAQGNLTRTYRRIAELNEAKANLGTMETDLKLDRKTLARGGEVFRLYCQQCHGIAGGADAPGSAQYSPLPRDYRSGLFKFITSDGGLESNRKPRRADLYRTITEGMNGSPMPQFSAIPENDLQAVISYVIHLSIRGESEYQAMKELPDNKDDVTEIVIEKYSDIAARWIKSEKSPLKVDADPYADLPMIDNAKENPNEKRDKLNAAAEGHKLFTSAEVGCTTCHVNYGYNAPYQFDMWGGVIRPRNLAIAQLKGGRHPDQIYSRVALGILGSNMPGHKVLLPNDNPLEATDRNNHKLWQIIYFLQYFADGQKRPQLQARIRERFGDEEANKLDLR